MSSTLDPITLEVLTQALIATVREMRATVCRTASSVAIYDAKDFSCGLFAPDSQVVAQSEDIGSHVVPLPWSVRAAFEKMGATLNEWSVIDLLATVNLLEHGLIILGIPNRFHLPN